MSLSSPEFSTVALPARLRDGIYRGDRFPSVYGSDEGGFPVPDSGGNLCGDGSLLGEYGVFVPSDRPPPALSVGMPLPFQFSTSAFGAFL